MQRVTATIRANETTSQGRTRERYGPWAVVTRASDGIGRKFADRIAEAGLNVVLVARREQVLAVLATELGVKHGVETVVVAADLATPSGAGRTALSTRPNVSALGTPFGISADRGGEKLCSMLPQ